jgi:AcrR family transcriptional regulator
MKNESFHHGNLRRALLDAAAETVINCGVERLSLRKLAEELNVSTAAPYRHFKNKDELIIALIDHGASEIIDAYREAFQSNVDCEERLYRACMAYLDYAIEKPRMFKLLFSEYHKLTDYYCFSLNDNEAFMLFEKLTTAVMMDASTRARKREVTFSCWALLHGFATLHMSANLETLGYKKENAVAALIELAKSAGK